MIEPTRHRPPAAQNPPLHFFGETAGKSGIDKRIPTTTRRMEPMFRLALLAAAVLALTACETTKGVGRDVQNAGEALDRTF